VTSSAVDARESTSLTRFQILVHPAAGTALLSEWAAGRLAQIMAAAEEAG
jgi:hypothetical protein